MSTPITNENVIIAVLIFSISVFIAILIGSLGKRVQTARRLNILYSRSKIQTKPKKPFYLDSTETEESEDELEEEEDFMIIDEEDH